MGAHLLRAELQADIKPKETDPPPPKHVGLLPILCGKKSAAYVYLYNKYCLLPTSRIKTVLSWRIWSPGQQR